MKLENKVSLVSACGRGIGKEVALKLAREGSDLIINSFSETNTESLVNELNQLGIKAIGVSGDITKSSVIVETVKQGIDTFGKIDILVNNVGGGAAAEIKDKNNNSVAKIIYSPQKPLPCGARVWIETDEKIVLDNGLCLDK